MIDYDKDYAHVWIDLQAEVKMLHNYCLKGEWATARTCAMNCSKYADKLASILQEMDELE